MKSQRGCVLRPALPCRIPRAWGKLAASRIGGTLQESLAVGETPPPQKRTAPLCSPGGKVLSGKPYESAHRRRPPWPQLFAACPSQAPVPVISPMSLRAHRPSEPPSAPRNDWKGPTRGRFALHSWILWVSGTEECGPQRLGWVRLGWELGEGAHKAERAGAKTGM